MSRWLGSSGSSELCTHAHILHRPLLIHRERERTRTKEKVQSQWVHDGCRNTAALLKLAELKVHTRCYWHTAPTEMSALLTVPRKRALITNTKWPQRDSHQGTRSIKMWQNNTNKFAVHSRRESRLSVPCFSAWVSLPSWISGLFQIFCLWCVDLNRTLGLVVTV